MSLTLTQGLPAAKTPAGIFLLTTLPAPMTLFDPMVTPGNMITPVVIQTLSPMKTGLVFMVEKSSKSCVDVMIMFL